LDVLGLVLWSYFLVKLFLVDIERWALRAISPELEYLADYRLIVYLAVLAITLVISRRRWWRVLYVVFFPIVVLFWKLPYLFYRRRSWPLFLATLQTLASVSVDLRYRFVSALVFTACAVLVLFAASPIVVAPAGIVLALLLAISIGKYVKRTIATPSFTSMQQAWIARLLKNDRLSSVWQLPPELRDPGIERYSDVQLQTVTMHISMGIVVNKVLAVWATKLDEYRSRYAPALVFAAMSFVWLFLTTLVSIALLNVALFKTAPSEFIVDRSPSLFSFFLHALGSMMGSQAGGIEAIGDTALGISLASGILGLLILLAIFLNVGLTLRRERDEASTKALAEELRQRASEQEELFVKSYAVGVDEARRRLEDLGAGFAFLVTWVTRSIAGGVDSSEDQPSPAS
jgi:hypothetical protein